MDEQHQEVDNSYEEVFDRSIGLLKFQVVKVHLDYIKRNYPDYDYQRLFKILNVNSLSELNTQTHITAYQHYQICTEIYKGSGSQENIHNEWYQSGREFYKTDFPDKVIAYALNFLNIDSMFKIFVRLACEYNKNYIYSCKRISKNTWRFILNYNTEIRSKKQLQINKELIELTTINTSGYVHGIADLNGISQFERSPIRMSKDMTQSEFDVTYVKSNKEFTYPLLIGLSFIFPMLAFSFNYSSIIVLIAGQLSLLFLSYLYYKKNKDLTDVLEDNIEKTIKENNSSYYEAKKDNDLKINKNTLNLLFQINENLLNINENNIKELELTVRKNFKISSVYFLNSEDDGDLFSEFKELEVNSENKLLAKDSVGELRQRYKLDITSDIYKFDINSEHLLIVGDEYELDEHTLLHLHILAQLVSYSFELKEQEKLKSRLDVQAKLLRIAKSVSHDLRSPLTALKLVKDEVRMSEGKSQVLHLAIERISNIANDLLSFKPEVLPIKVKDTDFDLIKALEEYVSEVQYISLGKKLTVIIPTTKYICRGSKSHFLRAVSNFVINADEASGEAGMIELNISLERGLVIEIHDSGAGLTEQQINELKKHNKLNTTKQDGHGLGISSSLELLKECGLKASFNKSRLGGLKVSITREGL